MERIGQIVKKVNKIANNRKKLKKDFPVYGFLLSIWYFTMYIYYFSEILKKLGEFLEKQSQIVCKSPLYGFWLYKIKKTKKDNGVCR